MNNNCLTHRDQPGIKFLQLFIDACGMWEKVSIRKNESTNNRQGTIFFVTSKVEDSTIIKKVHWHKFLGASLFLKSLLTKLGTPISFHLRTPTSFLPLHLLTSFIIIFLHYLKKLYMR